MIEADTSLRKAAVGRRIDRLVQTTSIGNAMRMATHLWLTAEPLRDHKGRPLRPYPIDLTRDANSDDENLTLLAAAYQALCPTADPIKPAVFRIKETETCYDVLDAKWAMLVRAVSLIPDDCLGYLDELIAKVEIDFRQFAESNPAAKSESESRQPRSPDDSQAKKPARRTSLVRHWDDLKLAAEIGVYRNQNPSLSLPQIAEKIGCDKSTLYRRAKKSKAVRSAIMMDVDTPAGRGDIEQKQIPRQSGRLADEDGDED
jgi:hypothetical protein